MIIIIFYYTSHRLVVACRYILNIIQFENLIENTLLLNITTIKYILIYEGNLMIGLKEI